MDTELNLLSKKCIEILRRCNKRVALAESCTGGLIAKCITDQSGASSVFDCGIVSYSGSIKHKILGVRKETLAAYGEVSSQTAEEMAKGVAMIADADIGIGVTGIAGPTGGTVDKKVGLIYVSVYFHDSLKVYRLELYDDMSRDERRKKTAVFVFGRIIELLS